MNFIKLYSVAYLIDIAVGDPNYALHPIRIIGKLITVTEKYLYRFSRRKISGAILTLTVVSTTFITSFFLSKLGIWIEIFLLYTTLATRCLADEGKRVYSILQKDDIELARKELSYLVSRDTATLDENQIIRGTLETISENSVDGVIAPMFYAFLGSFIVINGISLALPFAMTYKAVNTLDSMVGYKNDRYIDFGMVSAKLDDFANFIPARLAGGFLIPLTALFMGMDSLSSWKIFFRDRKNHSSPNSGNSESAFAGALGLQFGGGTTYFGKFFKKPTIGDRIREFEREDINRCSKLLYGSSVVAMLFFMGLHYWIGGYN
ncbi:MAG: adenosylcobinamide-phosphate synthase CbiB [Fusobacteriaceae bacterium]